MQCTRMTDDRIKLPFKYLGSHFATDGEINVKEKFKMNKVRKVSGAMKKVL